MKVDRFLRGRWRSYFVRAALAGGWFFGSESYAADNVAAYAWQRQPGAEVKTALKRFAPQLQEICVLAAEVSWSRQGFQAVRVPLDFAALAQLGCPIGLAIRVGNYAGMPTGDDDAIKRISALAVEVLGRAKTQGLVPAELQIDFDCPESKLTGYQTWLARLREEVKGSPLVFTALPTWLKHTEFASLARAADGFVLQVHSLEKPRSIDQIPVLCDPARAREWVRQAEKIGVDFRVALPTHGYLLGFGPDGKYLGLAAEGVPPNWPANTSTRAVRSDPVAMANLSRDLLGGISSHLRGVIWFRLPAAGDRFAWDAVTFATVLKGEVPQAHFSVEVNRTENGVVEIVLVNDGQTTEPVPQRIELRVPNSEKLLTGDGLGGFRLEMRGGEVQGISRSAAVMTDAALAPGRRMKIAWLRFAHDLPIEALEAPPP